MKRPRCTFPAFLLALAGLAALASVRGQSGDQATQTKQPTAAEISKQETVASALLRQSAPQRHRATGKPPDSATA